MKPVWKNRISMVAKESDLQRACTDYLDILVAQDKVRYCVVPDGDFRRRGKGYCPDIIVWSKVVYKWDFLSDEQRPKMCIPLFFELKSPKGDGRLTTLQMDFLGWLGDYEHTFFITNDFDEFKSIVDTALN